MPTDLSNEYATSFQNLENSTAEDKSQVAADEFARAIEAATSITMAGAVRIDGNFGVGVTPIARPSVTFDDTDLAALSQTVSDLMTALENLGLITVL